MWERCQGVASRAESHRVRPGGVVTAADGEALPFPLQRRPRPSVLRITFGKEHFMSRVRTWPLAVLAASVLGLAGCSSSSSSPSTTAASSPSTTAAPSPSTTDQPASSTAATIPVQDRSPAGTAGKEPTVTVPSGDPPTQLESADLIVGTGATAEAGDTVTVQYVLATYSTRKVIQSSWTSQPFSFELDATPAQVIPGWDEGVVGMKVGGRRELIIPPSLGYGAEAQPGGIAANDTLVFVVDLLKVS